MDYSALCSAVAINIKAMTRKPIFEQELPRYSIKVDGELMVDGTFDASLAKITMRVKKGRSIEGTLMNTDKFRAYVEERWCHPYRLELIELDGAVAMTRAPDFREARRARAAGRPKAAAGAPWRNAG